MIDRAKTFLILVCLTTVFECSTPSRSVWQCGWPSMSSNSDRIVGGWSVGYVKYPWYAGLKSSRGYHCGGTLIAPSYVVTAAHCFPTLLRTDRERADYFNVTLGIYDKCQQESTQRVYQVERFYMHELYEERKPYYDVALLRLAGDTGQFMPCCMPTIDLRQAARKMYGRVAGLGLLDASDTQLPCKVHEAKVKIYDDEVCKRMLDRLEANRDLYVNAVCAGAISGGIDTCQGDSGGPLTVLGASGEHLLLGITSYGYGCAMKGHLGIYTDVTYYLDWLQERMTVDVFGGKPILNEI